MALVVAGQNIRLAPAAVQVDTEQVFDGLRVHYKLDKKSIRFFIDRMGMADVDDFRSMFEDRSTIVNAISKISNLDFPEREAGSIRLAPDGLGKAVEIEETKKAQGREVR